MRIDVVSIFPEYLAPLDLSLIGKARRDGLLDVRAWNLRDFATDRHRTVDDTPYGGGAGMVMIPTTWGDALDAVLADIAAGEPRDAQESGDARRPRPMLIVPGPGGVPFTQALAHELATESNLVFACGRYEGIDERVYDYAREAFEAAGGRVDIVSLGDYVLNGGEVAVLAMVEAIGRLLPGVVGNAESLVEESHEDGLLEYPVYTKPPEWRGRTVPPVLLSGDHGAIAEWRHQQRLQRTALRRPDLLARAALLTGTDLPAPEVATAADVPELFTMKRACWLNEAWLNDDLYIPPLMETIDELRADMAVWHTWVVREPESRRLVASGRARLVAGPGDSDPSTWEVGRLMVAPDLEGKGIGRAILEFVLAQAPAEAQRAWLVTGGNSTRNQKIYRKAGFRPSTGPQLEGHDVVYMAKRLR
ncbi:MAG: tRNA (guanosine(37)-N1)-methyltransferase TrmD [Dermatophilus congolensis]|nr:tRNA (guanosine(37)-N1)-methyltransferase TrmD [Dermatophilus congolensis]